MAELGNAYKLEKPVEETIVYEKIEPHIATVTLNRPEKHNAFYPPDMFLELGKKIAMGVDDDEVKVIILKGNGPSFCTGDDLNIAPYESFGGKPGVKLAQSPRLLGIRRMFETAFRDIMYCPKNIIAQVHGRSMGYGLHLIEVCDLAVASKSATFAHVEQRIGFGGFAPGALLTLLNIGPKRYRELLLTGRTFTAQEAQEWGLINAVVPDDKLESETLRWARAVALHNTDGLLISKYYQSLMYDIIGVGATHTAYYLAHPLFTNIKWREDELNFLKSRITENSSSGAFQAREAAWGKFKF